MAEKAKKQKNPPEEPHGGYQLYRRRGYVKAFQLEDGSYSVYEEGEFYEYPADVFNELFINVPPAKVDNTELGGYE